MRMWRLVKELRIQRIKTFSDFFKKEEKRILVLYGGAGSGKSYAIAQHLIKLLYIEENKKMLILRKTLPSLKITAYRLILDLLDAYELPYKHNKSDMTVHANGNEILFKSLDDPEKVKSYEGNYIWVEEATDIRYKDFTQLNLRLRRKTDKINQMFLSFNPIDKFHWVNTKLIESNRSDIAIHHSTYLDNPFLSQEYVYELEQLKDLDENFYQIYTLGQFGIIQNAIYTNYDVRAINRTFPETIYGLDFGYNNPTAMVEIGIYDNEYYLKEVLFETHLTNQDLIAKLGELNISKTADIFADPSEPARIEEIRKAGYRIQPAKRLHVKDGIDICKSSRLHIDSNSVNLIEEMRNYKWKENRDGIILDEPVKFRDHLCDAFRYGISSISMIRGVSTPLSKAKGTGVNIPHLGTVTDSIPTL